MKNLVESIPSERPPPVRQEILPEILHKETKKLDASMADGTWKQGVGLDTDRPWNHCFELLQTPDVKVWWQENFKDHAVLVVIGARTVSQFFRRREYQHQLQQPPPFLR